MQRRKFVGCLIINRLADDGLNSRNAAKRPNQLLIMTTNIFTRTGAISAYGFACGYVERDFNHNYTVEIYMEHSHYHVRVIPEGCRFIIWETFDETEYNKAKKTYRSYVKQYVSSDMPLLTYTKCNPLDQLTKQLDKYLLSKTSKN